jgi:hypothetical protein
LTDKTTSFFLPVVQALAIVLEADVLADVPLVVTSVVKSLIVVSPRPVEETDVAIDTALVVVSCVVVVVPASVGN